MSNMDEQGVQPTGPPSHVHLKVNGQNGNEEYFKMKRSAGLGKLMRVYCARASLAFDSVAFIYDGRRIHAEQTPNELRMEDGDEIDAMLHQTGGMHVCLG